MNSRAKGKRGELELAQFLRDHGFEARRAQQFCGAAGTEDVTHNVPGVYLECKRVEAGNPYDWLEQAIRDEENCQGQSRTPVVAHRRNGEEWIAVLRLEDLLRLLKRDELPRTGNL